MSKNRIILEDDSASLTYSIAPYHKHHLMVVTKRHIEVFKDLNEVESKSVDTLLHKGVEMLIKLGYTDYTIVLRNGKAVGKSVPHLHYHIVPAVVIGDLDHAGQERSVMTEEEMDQISEDFDRVK
jgi:diadenosine tetraphosphate (Ap4A) HIT family hydrolase